MGNKAKTIAVMFAMDAEARPLVEHLALEENPSAFARANGAAPMKCFTGKVTSSDDDDALTVIHVVCAGSCAKHSVCNVGTVGAALSTYETCVSLKPDVIVNAGTAGGFAKRGGKVGDVYPGSTFKNHDRRIPDSRVRRVRGRGVRRPSDAETRRGVGV